MELHIATFFIKKHILCLMSTFNFNKEEEINLTIPLIIRPSILKANKQKLIPTRFQNKKLLDWMQDMRLHCLQSRLSYVGWVFILFYFETFFSNRFYRFIISLNYLYPNPVNDEMNATF